MGLINRFKSQFLDYLFVIRLRGIFPQMREELKKHFEPPVLKETYWTDCIHDKFGPPKQVKYVICNQTEINSCAEELVENWQVLPNSLKKEFFPLVKHLLLSRKLWVKRRYGQYSPHKVSDHIYEM